MEIIYSIVNIALWILGIYLLANCIYLSFFSVMSFFSLPVSKIDAKKYRKTAVLFPTYQENYVIQDSVANALVHQYRGEFEVIVIADGLEEDAKDKLRAKGAKVVEVFFEKSTKGKALSYTMNQLKNEGFEMAVVLDVDNLMGANCLNCFNAVLDNNKLAVQGHRTAKNMETSFAFLDACNEEINNRIYRKGPAVIGMSPSLIGSGMAFDFEYYRNQLNNIGETVGEDKQMDFMMAFNRVEVAYLDDVYIYDEKIENAKVFTSQRTRWIASQIEFLKKYAAEGFRQLFKGNFEFFNKTLQTFLMPRMLLLVFLFVMALQGYFNPIGPSFEFWLALFLALCLTLFVAVPRKFYADKRLYLALLQIPRAMVGMIIALMSIGKAKKSFMATPHSQKPLDKEI